MRVIEAGLKKCDVNDEKDDGDTTNEDEESEKKVDIDNSNNQMQPPPQLPAVQILPHMRIGRPDSAKIDE